PQPLPTSLRSGGGEQTECPARTDSHNPAMMTRSQRSNRNRGAVVEKSNREHREVHREMQQDRPIVLPAESLPDHPPPAPELVLDYRARQQFLASTSEPRASPAS